MSVPIIGQKYRNIRTIQRWSAPRPVPTQQYNRQSMRALASNETITIGDVLGFERTDEISVGFWVKTSATGGAFFGKQVKSGDYEGWVTGIWSGVIFQLVHDLSHLITVRVAGALDGQWHHVGFAYGGDSDANNILCELDGAPVTPTIVDNSLNATILNSPQDTQILWSANNTINLDEIGVWDTKLSYAEMSRVYRATDLRLLPFAQYLQAYWSGDGSDGSTLVDYSGNGYNGTPVNMDASNFTTDVHTPT